MFSSYTLLFGPPSITRISPVTHSEASEARKIAAAVMSEGSPWRPKGIVLSLLCRSTSSTWNRPPAAVASVLIHPRAMAFTQTW